MASDSETVMAVCAEWRACIEAADQSIWDNEQIAGLVKTTKAQQLAYLDRIDAAWRREKSEIEAEALAVGGIVEAARHKPCGTPTTEKSSAVGNAAARREALVELTDNVLDYLQKGLIQLPLPLEETVAKARAALSAPPRQCDVGTAEEQAVRFRDMCNKYYDDENPCNEKCPIASLPIIHGFPRCQAYWAQTPYAAEEGAGE